MVPTLLKLFQALKGDLEMIGITEFGRIVEDLDTEKRYDRHVEIDRGNRDASTFDKLDML